MTPDQEKVCSLLTDTVVLLCRSSLVFECDIKLQGILAVTVDSKNFFVVQIDEVVKEQFRDNISESSASENQLNKKSFELKHETDASDNDNACHVNRPVDVIRSPNLKTFKQQENEPDDRLFVDHLDNLMTSSHEVKVKIEDNLIVENSTRSSVFDEIGYNCGYNCGYTVPDCDADVLGTAFCDLNKSRNFAKQEQFTEEIVYDRLTNHKSFASDRGTDEFEGTQRLEFRNNANNLCHPMHLAVDSNWTNLSEKSASGRQPTTQLDPPPVGRPASTNRSTSSSRHCASISTTAATAATAAIFKPFACRFPGCQKRFCHETHTRRHERETHRYYRQRPHLNKLHPPATHDVVCHQLA